MARIQYIKGDIFAAHTQVIVNTVNCKGIMGKGLALAFKQRYPEMFPVYQEECKTGKLRIGRPTLYRESTPWILNFPTKDNWKANSKIEYLQQGLEYFAAHYKEAGITSIAFPKLGSQNGKLSWEEVGPLMVKYLGQLDIDISIYIADGDAEYLPPDKEAEKRAWMRFNEVALSLESLQNEVSLSKLQAKKVSDKRQTIEFTSFSDLHFIEGLAKVSWQHITDYINHQLYTPKCLPGMASEEKPLPSKPKNRSRPVRKKSQRRQVDADDAKSPPLFA